MKEMTIEALAKACDGKLYCRPGEEKTEVMGAVTDNRKVEAGNLFVPVVGARVDGHSFIPAAFESGAACCLSERELENPVGPYILVDSSLEALKKIAQYYRSTLTIPVIGVIGSVGKTSTKEMIAAVLSQKYSVLKTQGNLNNEIGLPLTLMSIRPHHQVAVVEMGISDFGEMHRLGTMARPDYVVMTNIGECHLEFLKTRDGILKAKTEVFDHLNENATVILNYDDDKLSTVKEVPGAKILTYGLGEEDFRAKEVQSRGLEGMAAEITTPAGSFFAEIPIPGEHNVYNALAAAAVGLSLSLTLDQIKSGIAAAETIAGRNHFLKGNGIAIIDDCYNASPTSMKSSLGVLANADPRRIAVLGDMGELGDTGPALHYQVGQKAAELGIEVLYTAGDLSKEIARGAREGGLKEIHSFDTVEELIPVLHSDIKKGDTLLIKASHFMGFPKIVEAVSDLLATD